VKLFRKNSNLCDHNSPTLQTDRQTDRQTTCDGNTALCTKVYRAVIKWFSKINYNFITVINNIWLIKLLAFIPISQLQLIWICLDYATLADLAILRCCILRSVQCEIIHEIVISCLLSSLCIVGARTKEINRQNDAMIDRFLTRLYQPNTAR